MTAAQREELDGRLADHQPLDQIAKAMGIAYDNVWHRRERLRDLAIDASVAVPRFRMMPPPNAVKGISIAQLMGGR